MAFTDDDTTWPAREALGHFIEKRLAELGWSQADLARAAGLTANTVRAIQSGKAQTHQPRTLHALARAVGWAPNAIEEFLRNGIPPKPEARARTLTRSAAAPTARIDISDLSESDQELVTALVERLRAEIPG